ncbi:MAG TPA: hypothetical protein VMT52_02945, partial [Planctomycetota bacterium]|nr:hypothetical protein [Planctomycetota bacterium]
MPLLRACPSHPASAILRAVCLLGTCSIASPLRGDGETDTGGEAAAAPRPGLIASYRSLVEPDASFSRIDLKPAFYLPEASIHPRLPAGPFEAAWTGHIRIEDETAPIRLAAHVLGEVSVEVDGVTVLEGSGGDDRAWVEAGTPLEHEPGLYSLRIRYRSPATLPARLQIWWEGADF